METLTELTLSLNNLLDEYFDMFVRGRTTDQMMPLIYQKVFATFETELMENIRIGQYDNDRLIESFRTNLNKWSIARNWKQSKEITDFIMVNTNNMTDEKVSKFLTSNKERFNKSWLETEIKTLNNTLENVNNFETFPNDASLMYMTAEDEQVRHSHRELNGLVMPKNDPRWGYLYPPPSSSPYNCRCRVVPVYDRMPSINVSERVEKMSQVEKTTVSKIKSKQHPLFSGEIFDSKSTYFKNVPEKIRMKNAI